MEMSKKNKITVGTLAGLSLIGAVGGTLAYLTDSEQATNTFTIGDASIEIIEPNWPGNDSPDTTPDPENPGSEIPENPGDFVPNEEIAKDPQVDNTGTNDVITFMTVDSPMERITVMADDGKLETAKSVNEIFWYKDVADGISTHANNFDSKWVRLADKEMYLQIDADGTETVVAKEDLETVYDEMPATSKLVYRYVFGYSEAIQGSSKSDGTAQTEENKKTSPLFDKVQLKNCISGEIDEADEEIVIRAYAIQAKNVLEDNAQLGDALDEESLNKVYNIFVTQNSTGNDSTGTKVENIRDVDDVTATENGASGTFDQHVNRWGTTDDVTGEGKNVKPSGN